MQSVNDGLDHRLCPHQNIIVPEPNNPPLLGSRHHAAAHIPRGPVVLRTISLDHQTKLGAGKVNNEWRDQVLTAKLAASHTSIADEKPQQTLGIGGIASEIAGTLGWHDHIVATRP